MKIYSLGGEAIPACAQFKVNGYTISLSTVFRNPCVGVFDSDGNFVTELIFGNSEPDASAENIAKAIAYCQSME